MRVRGLVVDWVGLVESTKEVEAMVKLSDKAREAKGAAETLRASAAAVPL